MKIDEVRFKRAQIQMQHAYMAMSPEEQAEMERLAQEQMAQMEEPPSKEEEPPKKKKEKRQDSSTLCLLRQIQKKLIKYLKTQRIGSCKIT